MSMVYKGRVKSAVVIMASVLMLVLCPGIAGASSVDGGNEVIFTMKHTGGFVMQEYARQRMSSIVVYKNGTIILSDRVYRENYNNYKIRKLSKSEYTNLISLVKWAASVKDWGMPGVSDMVSSELTLTLKNEKPVRVSVYALELAVDNDTGDFGASYLSKQNKLDRQRLTKGIEALRTGSAKDYVPTYLEAWQWGYREEAPSGGMGLANPASLFCVENGGELVNKIGADGGEYNNCLINGKEVEEWVYYRENMKSASKRLSRVDFINGCAKVRYSLVKSELSLGDLRKNNYFVVSNGRLDKINFYPVLPGFTACQR